MRIGLLQMHPVFGAVARNIAKAISMVRGAEADLWVLPELFATGYQFRDADEALFFAEERDGPTLTTMSAKAGELGCWFCGGFAERGDSQVFNSAFLVGPDRELSVYRKVHLFDREKELFAPGDGAFSVYSVRGVRVGMMVCFDWVFPESARSLARLGAEVICHPSNLVLPHCPEAMKTRALENRVFTFTANRVGSEDRVPGEGPLTYIGQSVAYSPRGERLLSLPADEEGIAVAEVTPAEARDKGITTRNDLFRDRRPEHYFKE